MLTKDFLRALHPQAGEGSFIELRAFTPGRDDSPPQRRWCRSVEEVLAKLNEWRAELDFFFGVASRRRRGGTKDDLGASWAFWADIDSPAAAEQLRTFALKPSVLVTSGSPDHYHAYWLLKEPLPLETPEQVASFESRNKGLARQLAADCGWDATRVLRLPGSFNHKTEPPTEVKILTGNLSLRYEPAEFEAWEVAVEPVSEVELTDEEVFVAPERLLGLQEWAKQMLRDGYPPGADRSGVDYGVCCWLLKLGLSPQEVLSVIRRSPLWRHNKPLRYWERTIAAAMAGVERKRRWAS